MKLVIKATNLSKYYDRSLAVDHIHFEIQEGQCFGFLGPNGAGKSSTLKMMYCFSTPSSGLLEVFGLDVRQYSSQIKSQMGVVSQEDNLDPDLTVMDNLLVYGKYFGLSQAILLPRIQELLQFMQLNEKKSANISELSGGMKRRLVIARALINNPKIIILDEPTTGLDPQARQVIWSKLRSLKKAGVTLVLTTHYMEEAFQLCDELVMMNLGKIIAQGKPADLVKNEVGEEVFEVRASSKEIKTLLPLLKQQNLNFIEAEDLLLIFEKSQNKTPEFWSHLFGHLAYSHRQSNLEDVFMKVAGRELKEF